MIFKTIHKKTSHLIFLILILSFNAGIAQLDSLKLLNQKLTELSKTSDFSRKDTTYINLLNNVSYRLRYTQLDSMELLAKEALDLSTSIGYKKGELEALSNYSALYLFSGNTVKAIAYGQKVREDKEIENFPRIEMRINNQLGQAYFITQDYPLTYTHFLNALDLGEEFNDEYYKSKMNMNLGTMFNLLEDYDEALVFYTAAEKSAKKLEDAKISAMVSSNLGYLYTQKGDYKKAEALLLECIELFKTYKITEWLAFSYTTMGQLNLKLNNPQEALKNYSESLQIHDLLNDLKGKADILYGMAKAYQGLKNIPKAEEYINESLNLYKSFKLNTGLEKSYRVLYQIKKEQNKIGESLKYLELTEELAHNILKEKNRRNLNMLTVKLNFEKEKENLKAENDLVLSQQRKYLIWSLIALLTLSIVVLLILRSNRREKLLNKKLESQAITLKENQDTLKSINSNQDKLFSIVGHDLRGPIISLKELINLYLDDDEGKKYFEQFAPQVKDDLEQLQFTMDNLLHWGKTQMKGYSINHEKIAVKKELETIFKLFRKEMGKKSLSTDLDNVDEVFVDADLDQFKIIFRNIISNAIKFTPEKGKISASTEIKETKIQIKISDTGLGMAKEVVNGLFQNTAYYSTYGTNLEKGTGLGLRLAKEMSIKNNGDIYVKSIPNKGSDFYVELPIFID